MNKVLFLFFLGLITNSCQVKPQEIAYGQDACHFCKMTIVDSQHAAEIVTVKGKAFKYDAIECMMNHYNKWNHPPVKFFLASDYNNPGELIDATTAHFLISESIPSPMGEFLTAFSVEEERNAAVSLEQDQALNWNELKAEFEISE